MGAKSRLFLGLESGSTCFGVCSYSATTFILLFFIPSILTFDFNLILGLFFTFCGPNGLFLVQCGDQKLFGFHSYSWTTLISYDSLNSDILIWLNVGLGVVVGSDNCFVVYSCSRTTFIFYVYFNSDIWFLHNFWVLFDFWGP